MSRDMSHGVGWSSSSSSAGAGSIGRSVCHMVCDVTSYDVDAAIWGDGSSNTSGGYVMPWNSLSWLCATTQVSRNLR